jgi:cytochrome c-type biogenesis protein CcmH/NrfG
MQGNKTLIALAAVVVVAAGAYYLLAGNAQAPTAPTAVMQDTQETLPAATDSVEDFAGALQADLAATAAALNAFDAGVTASLSELDAASDVTQLYDPEQI